MPEFRTQIGCPTHTQSNMLLSQRGSLDLLDQVEYFTCLVASVRQNACTTEVCGHDSSLKWS